jgi:DNA invertase Pin-like site-specific DNA recombinase
MSKAKKVIEIRMAHRAIVYLRVSDDEQVKDGHGLESQEWKCREFCRERGWSIEMIFRDEGVSAWADVKRPGFIQMMQFIAAIRNVNLVFFDYSRFGRHTRRALVAFERLDEMGIFSIAAMSPQIDCRTAQGRYARRDALSKAEDFSDQHSENQQARMKAALEAGRWLGKAPLGFVNVRAKKGEPNITPVEPAISLVRQSFELFEAGNDRPTALLRTMTNLGLLSRTGKEMTVDQFIRILKSVAYIGQVPSKKHGPRPGLHERVVSDATFKNVQLILKGKKPISAPIQRNRPELPLRSFRRCAHCDAPLTGGPSRSNTGKYYFYYRCTGCNGVKNIPVLKAEEQFVALLARLRMDGVFTEEFISLLKEEWTKSSGNSEIMVGNLERELKAARTTHNNLLMKYLNDDAAIRPHFERLNRELEDRITSLEAHRAEAASARATIEDLLAFSQTMLVDLSAAWVRANLDQRQRVQTALFPRG